MGRDWSKGLTFEQIHGDRADEVKRTLSQKLKGKTTGKAPTPELEALRRKKISESMKKNPKAGGYRVGSGVGKKCWYESQFAGRVHLDSSYELAYAQYLDRNDVRWLRNTKKFPYEWDGRTHFYIPDFLLEDGTYVEVKGYKTSKDEAKWKSFPHKLQVLFQRDLEQLKILECGTRGGNQS